ncbi:MAG: hypothetical protein BHV87_12670 [Clostridiales bacterium 36_14]|nr:MAG: hypothetical protein BHV87_12670 [Clostridiales bacterium 36_14]
MNYLELVNKILIEMNYRTVVNFDELVKQDHIKIKQILARVNTEICTSYDWDFLLRETTLEIPSSTSKIVNPIFGRIDSFSIDGVCYRFQPNYKKLLYNESHLHSFSVFDNYILLPKFDEAKTAIVTYYTDNSVVDKNGCEQSVFENENDVSLLPLPYAEMVLVYGTCMKFKGNPGHVKFKYWFSMFNDALSNLRSKSVRTSYEFPFISF